MKSIRFSSTTTFWVLFSSTLCVIPEGNIHSYKYTEGFKFFLELNKIFAKKGSIPETQLIIPHSSSIHANQSESIELLKSNPNMEGAVILF